MVRVRIVQGLACKYGGFGPLAMPTFGHVPTALEGSKGHVLRDLRRLSIIRSRLQPFFVLSFTLSNKSGVLGGFTF